MRTLQAAELREPVPVRDGVLVDDLLIEGDNLDALSRLPDGVFDLVYLDPPFNTGRAREQRRLRAVANDGASRAGFAGRRYAVDEISRHAYADAFDDYVAFLAPRLEEARRLLADHGTLYVHLDYREVHYVKVFLDGLFGRDSLSERAGVGL